MHNYEKHFLESKLTPDINYSIIRHVEMIGRQLRVIFVDFLKIIFRVNQISKSDVKKSFFQRPTRLGFWLVESFISTFQVRYAYEKHSLESKLTSHIIFQHHTTRTNDFATTERHFCRFLENQTPNWLNFFELFCRFTQISMNFFGSKVLYALNILNKVDFKRKSQLFSLPRFPIYPPVHDVH